MTDHALIDRHLDEMWLSRALAANTLAAYRRDLKRSRGGWRRARLEDARASDLFEYLGHRHEAGISRALYRAAVVVFARFLSRARRTRRAARRIRPRNSSIRNSVVRCRRACRRPTSKRCCAAPDVERPRGSARSRHAGTVVCDRTAHHRTGRFAREHGQHRVRAWCG